MSGTLHILLRLLRVGFYMGVLVVGTTISAFAANYATFEPITVDDGLSQGSVHSILQDKEGYLWFGTDEGLNKYYGYDFEVYKKTSQDSNSLSDNIVNALAEDGDGNIWIGTAAGLNRLNPYSGEIDQFTRMFEDRTSYIIDLMVYDGYMLWITTAHGIYKYDIKQDTSGFFIHESENLARARIDMIHPIGNGIHALASEEGLVFFNIRTHSYVDPPPPYDIISRKVRHTDVQSMLKIGDLEFWVGTHDGLYKLDLQEPKVHHYLPDPDNSGSLSRLVVNAIYQDRTGEIWVGTEWGLNRYNRKTDDFTTYFHQDGNQYSLSSSGIRGIYEYRSGILWFGTTHNGVNK